MYTEEQIQIRQSARQFAERELAPHAASREKAAHLPRELMQRLGALGMMGMLVPSEYGGAGADHVAYALAITELAAGDGACSTVVSVHNSLPCGILLHYGSEEQKERFLRPLAAGEHLGAFCLTEPEAGSDAAAIRTTARRRAGAATILR